jgi:5-methylcytosine-specific restriction endonuclease McrA
VKRRKAVSKSVRFEVFKRDSFKCQYCGRSAPDVVLNIEHITAVANGGDNEIMNLVTACFDCNRGKP